MRSLLVLFWLALASVPAAAQISFGFNSPGVSIGINVPVYPRLAPIPGYPVYYAPSLRANYFFYDGLYWVFQDGYWYESSWYNGPWALVSPDAVPLYLLRVPVRYYRAPPPFFYGWAANEPPRWHEHWGREWAEHHRNWDRWDHRRVPHAAPLPSYQQRFSGNRYPRAEEQARLRDRNYRYQPRDQAARSPYGQRQATPGSPQQRYQEQRGQRAAPQVRPDGQAQPRHDQRQAAPAPQRAVPQHAAPQRAAPQPRQEAPRRDQRQVQPYPERTQTDHGQGG